MPTISIKNTNALATYFRNDLRVKMLKMKVIEYFGVKEPLYRKESHLHGEIEP